MTRPAPAVVAIGGGHGLARTLGAARRYAGRLWGVVSVADDGGSSGRLRQALGIPAPGDLRRCLGALLPEGSPMGNALEHRFPGELDHHAFGNLLLGALAAERGGFAEGVARACQLLQTVGELFPATNEAVVLRARTAAGASVRGQVAVMSVGGVEAVALDPPGATTPPGALAAIGQADQIVLGPGSLFTSVLACLAAAELAAAVAAASATVVYVCNLAEQHPETAGFDAGMHLDALVAHGVVPDVMLVERGGLALGSPADATRVVEASLTVPGRPQVHDEALLGAALAALAG
ncbi:MAG: YvcK family protein [Actinomycetota bacterium]|nr:YvcK family protein [Actinomycetota bacterium]